MTPPLGRGIRYFTVTVTVFVLLVHFTPLVRWYARWLAQDWVGPSGDILIVLGGDMHADGLLGIGSYWRAVYAVRAYREVHYRAVILSGGHPAGKPSLASAMAEFLVANGVPREIIHLEDRSTSTRENALFTARMIAGWPGKKVLLTSDAHMFRAYRAFRAAGLTVIPCPIPDVLKRSNAILERWPCFWGLMIESVKIVYYFARGWI